jgi:transposase
VDGPAALDVPRFGLLLTEREEPSMDELTRVAVDTSKASFTVHGEDTAGRVVLRRELRRAGFEAFMAKLSPVEVVLEACGASHHWGRRLLAMGHRVRLIPPQYVRPFVGDPRSDRRACAALDPRLRGGDFMGRNLRGRV